MGASEVESVAKRDPANSGTAGGSGANKVRKLTSRYRVQAINIPPKDTVLGGSSLRACSSVAAGTSAVAADF